MPRRSEQHLSMRREQVLTAALRCFAEQGFHATSMADVIRESGLSAGSVYRYFPSKQALIKAGSEGIFATARGAMAELLDDPRPTSPGDALRHLLDRVLAVAVQDGVDLTRVGIVAWGEALRDRELHEALGALYGGIRDDFVVLLTRWRDAGHLPADTDVRLAGQALFGAVPGFLVQRLLLGDVDVAGFVAGFEALGRGRSPTT